MLTYLHVQNFALIRDAEIDFSDGLNILSGETGAGKSILMDSIALALGARQDAAMIRTGADHALVELVFTAGSPKVREALAMQGIATEEDGTLNAADYTPKGTVFTLPAQTQRIDEEAFAGVQMTEVDIPAGVSFIAEDAFEGCGLIAIYTHNNPYVISWAVSHGIIALTD